MAGHEHGRAGASRKALAFAVGFGLASVLLFLPVAAGGDLGAFASRTFGFQLGRSPAYSVWRRSMKAQRARACSAPCCTEC
jgi:hypothetical protein